MSQVCPPWGSTRKESHASAINGSKENTTIGQLRRGCQQAASTPNSTGSPSTSITALKSLR